MLPVARRQGVASNVQQLTRRDVGEGNVRIRQPADLMAGLNGASERSQVRRQQVRQHLRAAGDDGPANRVPGRHQHQRKRG